MLYLRISEEAQIGYTEICPALHFSTILTLKLLYDHLYVPRHSVKLKLSVDGTR